MPSFQKCFFRHGFEGKGNEVNLGLTESNLPLRRYSVNKYVHYLTNAIVSIYFWTSLEEG